MKNILLIFSLLFTILMDGQENIFQKNINYEARYLSQNLSDKGDSLLLKSEKTIEQVDIFNEDYMKKIDVGSNETQIGLDDLPMGDYIVQARLGKKRIIMHLTRRRLKAESLKTIDSALTNSEINTQDATEKITNKSKDKTKNSKTLYWVVYESNTGLGSHKSMSLEDKNDIQTLISKNKLEQNTEIGKNNTLEIYEVYDTSAFMRNQLRNSTYYCSTDSEVFNNTPYYSSIDNTSDLD